MPKKPVFIYALCEPGTRIVRYIGKSGMPLNKRLQAHVSGSVKHTSSLGDWFRLLHSLGERPEILKLCETTESGWREEEARYIQSARMLGFDLVNSNDGGGGPSFLTPEQRAARSAAQKGRRPSDACFAASRSPEALAKRSAAFKGRTLPPEWCAAISAGKKGVPLSPEHCAALSAAHKGVPTGPPSLETRAAISAAWTPERRAALSVANTARNVARTGVPWSAARRAAYERRWGAK